MAGVTKRGGGGTPGSIRRILTAYAQDVDPLRGMLFEQIGEALRTGGVGAQIPLVQRSVAESRRATGETMRGVERQLSAMGLLGTPFGQRQMAELALAGRREAARIPTEMAQQFAGLAPDVFGAVLQSLAQVRRERGPGTTQVL